MHQNQLTGVERVLQYTAAPQEAEDSSAPEPPPGWPSRGHLSVRQLSVQYRPGLPFALDGVSFEVRHGLAFSISCYVAISMLPLLPMASVAVHDTHDR